MGDFRGIAGDEFSATAAIDVSAISLKLVGNADLGVLSELEALVPRVHAGAQRIQAKEVVVDLTELEFMGSSCFRTFVNWVGWIRRLNDDEQYVVRFIAAPTQHWQRPSLQALSCFATNIVMVENLGL